MTDPHNRRPSKIDSIQLLRAIAALAVVSHHLPTLFGNGAWGVDIFFVISGFIICYVTEASRDQFFLKRIIRVVPLYWLGTLGVFCLALVAPQLLNNTKASFVDLLKSLLFIPYLKGDEVRPVLFLGWTLNYEMFFYLLFALSMAVSHKLRWLICSVVLFAIAAAGQVWSPEHVVLKFFTDGVIVEFAYGMLCYKLIQGVQSWAPDGPSAGGRALLLTLAAGLLVALPLLSVVQPVVGRAIAWGVPGALFFLCVVFGLAQARLPWPLVLLGDASYSLYLFHPYILRVFDRVFDAFAPPSVRAYLLAAAAVALCCVVSAALFKLVEHPVTELLRARLLPSRAPRLPQDPKLSLQETTG